MASATSSPVETVDVVLVTALHDEYLQVLEVLDGAIEPRWVERPDGPFGRVIARQQFAGAHGRTISVVATWADVMAGNAAAAITGILHSAFRPRCLAMTGIAAGPRGKVGLGDVVFGHRVFTHDTGKLTARGAGADRTTGFKTDPNPYRLDPLWKQRVEMFISERNREIHGDPPPWVNQRPLTLERQGDWLLARLLTKDDPIGHAERSVCCPDWARTLKWLRGAGMLHEERLVLSKEGRQRAQQYEQHHPDGPAPVPPMRVILGDIASGSAVIEDAEIFARIEQSMRKTIGLEMEAAAIAAVADLGRVPWVVAKGICDFADEDKDDRFHDFAARASAECLLSFLRAHADLLGEPKMRQGPSGKPAQPPLSLDPGYVPLPDNPVPSHFLVARFAVVEFIGRSQELADLDTWAEQPKPVAVRLLHGPGGAGKTRLLLEWVERRRKVGELAGFLRDDIDGTAVAWLCEVGQATVVIDYAETRRGLFELLRGLARLPAEGGPRRVRIVLLARNAGDWWESLCQRDADIEVLLAGAALPVSLEPLVQREERSKEFARAAVCFANRSGRSVPADAPALDDARFGRALYVHMAALAAVEGLAVSNERMVDDLLAHEGRFWTRRAGLAGAGVDRDVVDEFSRAARAFVGALALRGGAVDEAEAQALADRFSPEHRAKVVRLARDLYPQGGEGWIGTLEPDLLGEALVRRLATDRARPQWIDQAMVDASTKQWTAAFTILARVEVGEVSGVVRRIRGRPAARVAHPGSGRGRSAWL